MSYFPDMFSYEILLLHRFTTFRRHCHCMP